MVFFLLEKPQKLRIFSWPNTTVVADTSLYIKTPLQMNNKSYKIIMLPTV